MFVEAQNKTQKETAKIAKICRCESVAYYGRDNNVSKDNDNSLYIEGHTVWYVSRLDM